MQRIVIIGSSCAGKTTLAKNIAQKLAIPHFELDALHWKANWVESSAEEFRRKVQQALNEQQSWVIDGNYSRARDIIWPKATTLIWLNYAFPVVFYRAIKRTIRRAWTKEKICGENYESFRQSFLSKNSILIWVVQTHAKKIRDYDKVLQQPEHQHLKQLVFRNPNEAKDFLNKL